MSPENLDRAATHAKTAWLKDFVFEYFPKLTTAQISIEDFAAAVDRLLTDRDLHDLKQQKNPRSNLVQALKSIDSNHPAIPLIALTTEQYRELNESQQLKLSSRETRFITKTVPLVTRATELLDSAEWSDIAAGLAFLIGRRIGEIMLSKFSINTPWSLNFSEMSKKSIEHQITIEIPTLAPANIVLAAIDKLQHTLNIADLKLENLNPAAAKKKVSDKYAQAVSTKCDRHYRNLIPTRSDRESLYTHVFRAAYVAISIHWYCPPHVPDYAYRAEILGHYTIGSNGEKIPDYKAGANYADYAIGNENGNRDGRLGIKLGTIDDLQILTAFAGKASPSPIPFIDLCNDTTDPLLPKAIGEPVTNVDDEINIDRPLHGTPPGQGKHHYILDKIDIHHFFPDPQQIPKFNFIPEPQPADAENTIPEHPRSIDNDKAPHVGIQTDPNIAWFINQLEYQKAEITELKAANASLRAAIVDTPTQEITSTNGDELLTEDSIDRRDEIIQQQNQELATLRQTNAELVQSLTNLQSKFDTIAQVFGGVPSAPVDAREVSAATDSQSSPRPPLKNATINETLTDKRTARYVRSLQMVDRVVTAAIAWNDKQDRSDRRLLLSLSGLKPLCLLLSAASQPAIQEVLHRRADELAAHHVRFAIGQRHNASIDLADVLKSIAKDELHLDNWEDVMV